MKDNFDYTLNHDYEQLMTYLIDKNIELADELEFIKQNSNTTNLYSLRDLIININEDLSAINKLKHEKQTLERVLYLLDVNKITSEQILNIIETED